MPSSLCAASARRAALARVLPAAAALLALVPAARAQASTVEGDGQAQAAADNSTDPASKHQSSDDYSGPVQLGHALAVTLLTVGLAALAAALLFFLLRRRRRARLAGSHDARRLATSRGPSANTREGPGAGARDAHRWSVDDAVGLQADGAALAIANRERTRMLLQKEREERARGALLRAEDEEGLVEGEGGPGGDIGAGARAARSPPGSASSSRPSSPPHTPRGFRIPRARDPPNPRGRESAAPAAARADLFAGVDDEEPLEMGDVDITAPVWRAP